MRVRSVIKLLLPAAVLAGLLSCGTAPSRMPPPTPQPTVTPPPRFQTPGTGVTPTGAVDPAVQQLLAGVARAYQQANSVKTVVKTFSKKGSKSVSNQIRLSFVKPKAILIDIYGSTDDKLVGTQLLWRGGDKVEVKTKFIGFPIHVTVDLTDERIKDTRGYRIDEIGVPGMIKVLLDPNGQQRVLGERVIRGRPAVDVEVRSALTLRGLTREVFSIDKQTMIPLLREGYEGQTLVYRNQMDDVRLNTVSLSQMTL